MGNSGTATAVPAVPGAARLLVDNFHNFSKLTSPYFQKLKVICRSYFVNSDKVTLLGAALGTAGTAVAVPEFPIISSVLGDIFHFVGKPTNLVGF